MNYDQLRKKKMEDSNNSGTGIAAATTTATNLTVASEQTPYKNLQEGFMERKAMRHHT
jgi:hypothetical protein